MLRLTRACLLVALLGACGDKDGATTTDDADGDGFPASEDCDDSDASIYPGAEDTWYDSIDSDCADNNDHDADGDGVIGGDGGADCDDTDPNVNPTVDETWYDGIDGDCAGGSDYDADLDGQDSDDYGGTDCDDTDDTVWLGATEVPYDGVDSDCDGASDYDLDGDGQDAEPYGEDCDDDDATVYTGATDTWYDGIDSDCDGADDDDADGDGWGIDDDCDDTSDTTYPGADELFDGVDTDCEGDADIAAADDDYGGAVIVGVSTDDVFGSALAVGGDVDGDGAYDLVVAQEADTGETAVGYGVTHVFIGGIGAGVHDAEDAAFEIYSSGPTGPLAVPTYIGDFDDAGGDDLAIGAPIGRTSEQVGLVVLLTAADLTSDDSAGASAVDRLYWGAQTNGTFGEALTGVEDMDADGIPDLVVADPTSARTYLFRATNFSATGSYNADDADQILVGDVDSLGGALADLGDLDGDGYGDLAIAAPEDDDGAGAIYVVSTDGTWADQDLLDLTWLRLQGDAAGDGAGSVLATGDFDDDGTRDLVVGAVGADDGTGVAYVMAGADLDWGSASMSDIASSAWTGPTAGAQAGTALATGDADGDGIDDLLVGGPGDSDWATGGGQVWLLLSPLGAGTTSLESSAATLYGGSDGDAVGASVGIADMDGDGTGDLVFGALGEDGVRGDEGVVYVAFGAD